VVLCSCATRKKYLPAQQISAHNFVATQRKFTFVHNEIGKHPQRYGTPTRSAMELQFVEQEAASSVLVLPRIWCGFRRTIMKKLLLLATAASFVATTANAQTTVTTTGAAPAAVQIEPQYRTKIKTYITENKVRPVQSKEKIVVGAKVPSDVELVAVPSDWGPSLTKYRYVYSGDRVMLVDPGTRTVVQEVD
jgi:Protein of unknown function (DUF1236)